MSWIAWVEDEDATGQLAEIYAAWKKANPGRDQFPGILKCFSSRPDLLKRIIDASYGMHFVERKLSRRVKEMIATYVSALNQCRY